MTEVLPGTIGPHEIIREIGRGGMGVVYLAHDSVLDRNVAVKVLPDDLLEDAERLERFEREAKLLASVNHANIASIYSLERLDGRGYLILEYVEGETLADRLKRGDMSMQDALRIARDVAAAMEAAHRNGIIHRDLKPANIMVTADDHVKVLDFGVAKALINEIEEVVPISDSPTVLRSPTIPGVILGTAGYMSPEQARGRPVDHRSDIWSFGCIFYEMLTGKQCFPGETVTDSLGAIIHKEPDWSALPNDIPPLIRLLLKKCLAKLRDQRLHSIADARLDIETAINDPDGKSLGLDESSSQSLISVPLLLAIACIISLIVYITASPLFSITTDHTTLSDVIKFSLKMPEGMHIGSNGYLMNEIAISPDGRKIAAVVVHEDKDVIYVHDLASFEGHIIPGTEDGLGPFFSPDGKWLGFMSSYSRLTKVSLDGGEPQTICPIGIPNGSAAWLKNGTIVFTGPNGLNLLKVSDKGGTPEELFSLENAGRMAGFENITPLSDGSGVLVNGWFENSIESYDLAIVTLTGEFIPVLENAAQAFLLDSGLLVFLRGSSLYSVPFDVESKKVTGQITPILEGVATEEWAGGAQFCLSPKGTMVYVPGGRRGPDRKLVWVDRMGAVTPLSTRADCYSGDLRLSPDGSKLALRTLRRSSELWIHDIERDVMTILHTGTEAYAPTWSPDGQFAAFIETTKGRESSLSVASTTRSDELTRYLIGQSWGPREWLSDGNQFVLVGSTDEAETAHIATWTMGSDEGPQNILPAINSHLQVRLSPDGKWMAFGKPVSDSAEVVVRRFPDTGEEWQVSDNLGWNPIWSRNGDEIYYLRGTSIMAAKVTTRGGFSSEKPVELFKWPGVNEEDSFDVAPDGRFAMIQLADWELEVPEVRVVVNWDEELKQLTTPE